MEFQATELTGAWLIKPRVFADERGFFLESYVEKSLAEHGISDRFVQDNHSRSTGRGVLRGLHFQCPPHAQAKLVRVARGSICDVIVDLRVGSPSYRKWQSFELNDENMHMLYVPEGFAHGFCTLSDEADVVYKAGDYYAPEQDAGLIWNDPDLAVEWPVSEPCLSAKDSKHPALAQFESPFTYDG